MENQGWLLMINYRDGDDYNTSVIFEDLIYTTKEAAIEALRRSMIQKKVEGKEYVNITITDDTLSTRPKLSTVFAIGNLNYNKKIEGYIFGREPLYWVKEMKFDCRS